MTEVKRPMSVRRIGADRFDLGFTWTITGFSFVLGKVSGQWRIIAYSSPSESPIPHSSLVSPHPEAFALNLCFQSKRRPL